MKIKKRILGILLASFTFFSFLSTNAYAIEVDNDSLKYENDIRGTTSWSWEYLHVGNFGDSQIRWGDGGGPISDYYAWIVWQTEYTGNWGIDVYLNNVNFNNPLVYYSFKQGYWYLNQETALAGYNRLTTGSWKTYMAADGSKHRFEVTADTPGFSVYENTGADTVRFFH